MRLGGLPFEAVRIAGDRIVIAGHLPLDADGAIAGPLGKVGADVSPEEGHAAARRVALAMLASLEAAGIDLDRVEWRKAFGMVNAAPGFNALPGVVNGFSELLLEVFGERGRHSRSAVGVAELPFGAPVEVEAEVALLPAVDAGGAGPTPRDRPVRGAPSAAADPGLRLADYAGISPLTLPAEALLRAIRALSNLFWISIGGTVLAIFLAALANVGGSAGGVLALGEYTIPLSVLPIGCLAFAMFMLWLTAARFRMLDAALGDDDLTASLARDIFRLDPPVLDVFDAGNLRPFAPLSGCSMLLWIWCLFFGSSIGLIFSATVDRGSVASTDEGPIFALYTLGTVAIMAYGGTKIVRPLGRILATLHGGNLALGPIRVLAAIIVLVGGALATNPGLFTAFTTEQWRTVGPSRANAVDGETLVLEGGEIVSLGGIAALRPGQTCGAADGDLYPCGDQATAYLQSLVRDRWVHCFVRYPHLGVCMALEEGEPPPPRIEDALTRESVQARMVLAGFAFPEGEGTEFMGEFRDEAQRARVGAWRGSFEPVGRWAERVTRD